MAIEVTVFMSTSSEANAAELYDWLLENASEYFDEVVKDSSGVFVSCMIGSTPFLKISSNGGYNTGITLPGGDNLLYTDSSRLWRKAYKTSKGIALFSDENSSIFISKFDNGTTCAVAKGIFGYHYCRIIGADVGISTKVSRYPSSGTGIDNVSQLLERAFGESAKAAIVPYLFDNGTYSPDILLVPFSPILGISTVFDLDGTKYVYDGCLALRE